MRRKTSGDYIKLAESRRFKWLGPEVKNTKTKTGWECRQGHRFESRYNNVLQGQGCPHCAGNTPKTAKDYSDLANSKNLQWWGPQVKNIKVHTLWSCKFDHFWWGSFNGIQQGHGCPICGRLKQANSKRKKPKDYHILATRRGFKWLGPEALYTNSKTWWECSKGHKWEGRFNSIQHGIGCPFCAGLAPKIPEDYHALAKAHGFKWIGPEVPNIMTKTGWECSESHRWKKEYNSIRNGSGCPYCAGLIPKTVNDYNQLATEHGYRWLGPRVTNTHIKTLWECELRHRWWARYNDIQQNRGCPHCANLERSVRQKHLWSSGRFDGLFKSPTSIEIALSDALDNLGIKHHSQYRPKDCTRVFDEFIPSHIFIEAHGSYWHGSKRPQQQKKDAKKAEWAEEHGYHLIVFWEHEINELGAEKLIRERIVPLL